MKKILLSLIALAVAAILWQQHRMNTIYAQSSTSATTTLLFPYFSGSDASYSSLLEIENNSMDPYGNAGTPVTCYAQSPGYTGASVTPGSLGTIAAGTITVFTVAQVDTAASITLANSGQRAYVLVTCNGNFIHGSTLVVDPGGSISYVPALVVPSNRAYTTGPEQLLQ